MTTHELIEMASLDALGLLDPEEREAFERAFRTAPPSVQAQIRRDQLRYSAMDEMLPPVEAPLGLKARVLAAVQNAMSQVSGRRSDVLAKIPELRSSYGVNRYWRAAAIGAMAASLVLAVIALQVQNSFKEISSIAMNSEASRHLSEFGRRFDQSFFDHNTRFVKFTPAHASDAEPGLRGKATLLFDSKTGKAELLVKDLPTLGGSYEVVVIDAHGNRAEAVLTFSASNAGVISKTIQNLNLENASSLVIRQQGASEPLLSANDL